MDAPREVARLTAELRGLEPEEVERRLRLLRPPDFASAVTDEEYSSYVYPAVRGNLNIPEPDNFMSKHAVPILLSIVAALCVLIWATSR
ncbi:hypothetical protein [Kitasatospora sp. NPDC056800]|uniref:hypothetical protein n=1 Tax=Kitasatospora sp. NPDC056800 TaxID=3345948 RepID=UPI0036D1B26C